LDWLEITIVAAAADEEAVSDVLRVHAGGVAIEESLGAPGGRDGRLLSLKAYLPRDARLALRRRALRRALSRIETSQPLSLTRSRTVREEDWANAWKEHFRVERVGRLVIRPRWRRYAAKNGETVITLDPGMAFGTGQHPTTRMCLLALQERLIKGSRVLDLGAGSGILAIAAALLGAAEVVALDSDPLAVGIAKENVAANGVETEVSVAEGSLGTTWPFDGAWQRRFDCVVANISSATIIELSGDLASALRSGGLGIAGGISNERVDDCRSALEAAGARLTATVAEGDWRTLLFEVA
jgi:ribosomal protein L11 methyltransferase